MHTKTNMNEEFSSLCLPCECDKKNMKINVVHKRFYMKLHKAITFTNMKLNLIQSQELGGFKICII